MLVKYFAQTIFDSVTMSTAATTATSGQFDIGEISRLWLQLSSTTAGNNSPSISIQLQVSNDAMVVPNTSSTWINQDSAASFTGASAFDKHSDIAAQKFRVQMTNNSGGAVVTVRASGKI